jgi:carboxypeptidase Taq
MEVGDLKGTRRLLQWDQSTYMPPGGAAARGRQIAIISRLAHEKFTDAAIGKLLDDLRPFEESHPYGSDEASLIRISRGYYERALKVPPDFMAELYGHFAETYEAWARARPANDFSIVEPYLEKTLQLSRQYANYYPGYEHIADPLIDRYDFGVKASFLRQLFAALRKELIPILDAIAEQPQVDDGCLKQSFLEERQIAFGNKIVRRLGYDFSRGRLDKTLHPFMTMFSLGDVRITTRVKENDLSEALFSTIHEAGHAMYEQGFSEEFEATPLIDVTSLGMHESQSRLWENQVGRSRPFWDFYYPKLQDTFPDQLGSTSVETFYQAINRVAGSLIRTDADEVTYNLHVIIRFDLELEMLEGKLAVRDLPEAWRQRYQTDLGFAPPDDRDGVMQDAHWYDGTIGGAFQSYTLGNLMSAQIFDAALQAHPEIWTELAQGEFHTLHNWLVEKIYQHGAKFTADELMERVTGTPLAVDPLIKYLRKKFGDIYNY